MRVRIYTATLRSRFDGAWGVLPASDRGPLRRFIRYVDEVPELEGSFIYGRPSGGRGQVDILSGPLEAGTGFTALLQLNSRFTADILLPHDPLGSCDEGVALAIILHELAHAYDFCTNPEEAAAQLKQSTGWWDHFPSECRTWETAADWAMKSPLEYRLRESVRTYAAWAIQQHMVDEFTRLLGAPPHGVKADHA